MQNLLENQFVDGNLGGIFNTPEFFKLHSKGLGKYFEWESKNKVQASIHFTPTTDHALWRSPLLGTYGGISTAANTKLEALFPFYDAVENCLYEHGARKLEVLLAPFAHDNKVSTDTSYLLMCKGFKITKPDINHHIDITDKDFTELINYGNLKKLKKCYRDGMKSTQLPPYYLRSVHEVIRLNRAEKGIAISMNLKEMQEMVNLFPDRIKLFGCFDGKIMIAASICIQISPEVLYIFYWGDLPSHRTHSPIVAIAETIYKYSKENGVKILDAGTSSVGINPNFGLVNFKENLGFQSSLKLKMEKSL